MEVIELGILFKDKQYAEAVARVIAGKERYFLPTVLEQDRIHNFKGQLIITDCADFCDERIVFIDGFALPKRIIAEIKIQYENLYGKNICFQIKDGPERSQLVLVTGASGGAGITAAADGLAEEFAVYYDKTVCRLSLSAFPEGSVSEEKDTLAQFLFNLAEDKKKEKVSSSVMPYRNTEQMISASRYFEQAEDGVYRAAYGQGINPLALLTAEELQDFFGTVTGSRFFDLVIADVPAELLERVRPLFFSSAQIVSVVKNIEKEMREKRYEKYLSLIFGKTAEERIFRLRNSITEEKYHSEGRETQEEIFAEYDPDSFAAERVRIDGTFGLAMKDVAHKLSFC